MDTHSEFLLPVKEEGSDGSRRRALGGRSWQDPFLTFPHDWEKEPVPPLPHLAIAFLSSAYGKGRPAKCGEVLCGAM